MRKRDYSLLGEDTARAKASGLANAKWYIATSSRKGLKQLIALRFEIPPSKSH